MKRLNTFISSLFLLFVSVSLRADLLSASVNYANGEYTSALEEFKTLATLGNSDAMFNIAVMYHHGRGVKKDASQAYAWFSLAGQFGINDAAIAAKQIEQAASDKEKLLNAYNSLQQSINLQDYHASLAPIFNEESLATANLEKRFSVDPRYPEHAIDKGLEGWVWAEFEVDAIGAVKNIEIIDSYPSNTFDRAMIQALKRWRYESPSKPELATVSLLYHFTTFKGKRYQQGFARQQRAYQKHIATVIEQAENGNALWQYRIANWLSTDKHNASQLLSYHWPNKDAAQTMMLDAAKNGYPLAQYRIANQLLLGDKTKLDRKKGLNWLVLAAQNGQLNAQYRLGLELLVEQSVHYDLKKANRWLEQAASNGHTRAQLKLAQLLLVANTSFDIAEEYLTKVIEKQPQNTDALFLQGKLLSKQNKFKAAKSVLTNALSLATAQQLDTNKIETLLSAI